ncbi:hypothetical protein ACKLNR_005686 [Fusarium oxysporum f. sp. zingiberi]
MALWHLSCFNSNQPADLPPRLNFSAPPTPLIRPPRPRSLTRPFTSTAHSLLYSITGVSTFITLWIPQVRIPTVVFKTASRPNPITLRSRHPPVFPIDSRPAAHRRTLVAFVRLLLLFFSARPSPSPLAQVTIRNPSTTTFTGSPLQLPSHSNPLGTTQQPRRPRPCLTPSPLWD